MHVSTSWHRRRIYALKEERRLLQIDIKDTQDQLEKSRAETRVIFYILGLNANFWIWNTSIVCVCVYIFFWGGAQ